MIFSKIGCGLCRSGGARYFEFITDADHSYFVTRLFVKEGFDDVTEDESYLLSEKGDKKGDKKGLKKNDEILQRMDAVLLLISSKNDITIPEIMTSLNITKKQTEIAIKKLKETGRIQRKGESNGGYWEINNPQKSDE